ncbi:MAG TPA: [protein-PII] uridylyltransferase [Verrucomicrobiae bacterium]|jgi:[protein-PII] uridylyltransferase|nr:[protein-PII] uridylyltransferase [Verrucomicrobiae bacterium]
MEANAAVRLAYPAGHVPNEELARFKTFLKVETHRLKILHRAGAGGLEICRARAAMLDLILRRMWDSIVLTFSPESQKNFPPIALIAIGGYGRAELNPQSDIDFMFLHEGQVSAGNKPLLILSRMMDGILYPLWDLGLKVGYSVRNIDDCVSNAQEDMLSKTALIESRLIAGSEDLYKKLQKTIVRKLVEGNENKYIAARLEDQAARHTKFGNSPSMQEPNIKNGCGGLRDHQNLLWMAYFKYRTRTLAELQERELITESERKQLETAYDYLLRARNELHYHVGRPVDALSKNVQPAVAHNLGFHDRSPSVRLEKFMRQLYTHFRNIYIINRTLEQRLALLPAPKRLQFFRGLIGRKKRELEVNVVDGFKFIDGYIHAANPRVFRDQPRRLMRVFLQAQQRGLQLHPDLAQLIRSQLSLADRAFLYDEHVRETFLTILNQRGNVAPVLRQMHEVGLLGKYIPEFGRLTCLVQHEFYHQYTADEHTLMCLEKLDRIWEASEEPYAHYAQLFQDLGQPFLLYLALLLHDVGKSDGHGKHAVIGAQQATRVAKRLALDGATTHSLRLIIENHLTMANISQRRDLDDNAVIRAFAKEIQTPANLAMLTLHTFADSMATSDKLWNDFKDALLWTLYRKTVHELAGGTDFIRAEARQRELLAEEIGRSLPGRITAEELHAHFGALPGRYFQIHTAPEITRDLVLSHRFLHVQLSDNNHPLEPIVDWHNEPDRGFTVVKICTWDRAELFHHIAGSLSASGLNILSAQIFTRSDAIVLDTFFVTDARTGAMANKEEREKFEKLLAKVLTGGDVDFPALVAKQKGNRPPYQSYEGDRMPTCIRFDNETSDSRTAIEIETEDRVGLLYVISLALAELDLNITAAKIVTERGAAIDTFYINEQDGGKILDAGRQEFIERKIRDSIQKLG